jgi:hypothetical protein
MNWASSNPVLPPAGSAWCARSSFGGAATLAVTGIWMKLFPVLSRMDRFPHHEAEEAARKAG